eukprot:COSAG02_NODE_7764_length_2857_cov_6.127991_4_plen_87_part_00
MSRSRVAAHCITMRGTCLLHHCSPPERCVLAARPAECTSWRQTGGCDPHGEREPNFDKPCSVRVQLRYRHEAAQAASAQWGELDAF